LADKTAVRTEAAPPPLPTFSQGVRKGPLLQVSGQGAIDPATVEFVGLGDVAAQTRQTLENVKAILAAGGASFDDVVMVRVYLTTRDHFGPMNDEYAKFLAENVTSGVLPCRTTVVTGLPLEVMLIEVDALAVLD
jgi:2-iminobutanoate/2-iminopropanoate deaminase